MTSDGWKMNRDQSELQAQFGGAEVIALNATGVAFHGSAPVAQSAAITDLTVTGTYADDDTPIETLVNSVLAALRAHGIIAI